MSDMDNPHTVAIVAWKVERSPIDPPYWRVRVDRKWDGGDEMTSSSARFGTFEEALKSGAELAGAVKS